MSDPAPENGRATIREVYALVERVDAKIDAVDAKVDALAATPRENAMRLTIIERACKDRPEVCALKVEKAIRELAKHRTDQGWTRIQRYGWAATTVVALIAAAAGLLR